MKLQRRNRVDEGMKWLVLVSLVAAGLSASGEEPPALVVHEWGVLVQSNTTQGPMLSGPKALVSELPDFVLRHARTYVPHEEFRNWSKPVLHFYGPENLA